MNDQTTARAHLVEVGTLLDPERASYPERSEYNYRCGVHTLLIALHRPTQHEVESIESGRGDFALNVFRAQGKPTAVVMSYRFGTMPWSDNPYTWYMVPEDERVLPDLLAGNEHPLLTVFLVDADTGVLMAMRVLTFSPSFGAVLIAAIREQAAQTFDQAAYDTVWQEAYRQLLPVEMAVTAPTKCEGGS